MALGEPFLQAISVFLHAPLRSTLSQLTKLSKTAHSCSSSASPLTFHLLSVPLASHFSTLSSIFFLCSSDMMTHSREVRWSTRRVPSLQLCNLRGTSNRRDLLPRVVSGDTGPSHPIPSIALCHVDGGSSRGAATREHQLRTDRRRAPALGFLIGRALTGSIP